MELEDRENKMKNLTEGNTYKNLILFSLPILFGNLLQLTYNAVDSVIVGKYAGEIALAAVGISNPIMSILILGASGVSIGASAYTGKCYGAGKKEELKKAFASVLIIGIIMSAVIMIPGFLLTGTVLNVMQVPKEALMISEVYLRIILLSFPFNVEVHVLYLLASSVFSGLLAWLIQFFQVVLNYSAVEYLQFEDDEYYYYVKAVPKMNIAVGEKRVKRFNAHLLGGSRFGVQTPENVGNDRGNMRSESSEQEEKNQDNREI